MSLSRRVVLEGLPAAQRDLRLTDLEGRDVSAQLTPRSEDGKLSVTLSPAIRTFIVKPREIPTLTPAAEKLRLPGGIVNAIGDPTAAGPARAVWFRLTLDPSPVPAVWDGVRRQYGMRLTFGVEQTGPTASDSGAAALQLTQPITVKFAYDGMTAAELPPLILEAAGLDHEKTVDLHFVPSTPSPRLLVRSSIADANLPLKALPRLEVRPVQRAVAGLGLASVDVVIERVQPHGERITATQRLPVVIEIDGRATPEPRQPVIEAGAATTSFTLSTAGLGKTTIRASADGVMGAAVVEQMFPFGPVIAVLLGGALGGYARRFVKGARRSATGRRVTEGLLVGVVAFVAGVLGVGYLNVPPAIVATEAGAFLTGALCGFVGVTVLEALTKKTTG